MHKFLVLEQGTIIVVHLSVKSWFTANYGSHGKQICQFVLLPFWKGVYFKRKEFAFPGSKFFPFKVDPFSEEAFVQGSKQEVTKVFFLVKKVYPVLLDIEK